MPVEDAVEHVVGLQAQNPLDPYSALWSRLEGFDPAVLADAVVERRLVRIVVMRGTIHLVTADDCLRLRPLVQPVLDGEMARHSQFKATLAGLDLEPVLAFARPYLAEPRSVRHLRAALAERFPDLDPGALAPGVPQPPRTGAGAARGVWGRAARSRCAPPSRGSAGDGRRLHDRRTRAAVPAGVRARHGRRRRRVVTRLTGFRRRARAAPPAAADLRRRTGPGALRRARRPRCPTPTRRRRSAILPEYDNVLLSFADRSRFGGFAMAWPDQHRREARARRRAGRRHLDRRGRRDGGPRRHAVSRGRSRGARLLVVRVGRRRRERQAHPEAIGGESPPSAWDCGARRACPRPAPIRVPGIQGKGGWTTQRRGTCRRPLVACRNRFCVSEGGRGDGFDTRRLSAH